MATSPVVKPNLLIGPGFLFWAPIGTTEPAATAAGGVFTDTWPVAWLPLGATTEGSKFGYQSSMEGISVAEFFDPIQFATTGRNGSVEFNLASFSLTNIKYAMNGGALTSTGTGDAAVNTYTPPNPGEEVRCMLGWESEDHSVRYVVSKAIAETNLEATFGKAPNFASIPIKFNFEIAAGATAPFKLITAGASRG